MDYKRQTTVLSVVFILAGMMLLVPAITDKVLALTAGHAFEFSFHALPIHFTNLFEHLFAGKFKEGPTLNPDATDVNWVTAGSNIIGGDEKGWVRVDVVNARGIDLGTATFNFNNPDNGPNTCSIELSNPRSGLTGSCKITQGDGAVATYVVDATKFLSIQGLRIPLLLP